MLNGRHANLDLLVKELLLARTEGLGPRELAAFVDGWSSLLGLLERIDLTVPAAPPELRVRILELVQTVRSAQSRVLDDEGDGGD